MTWNYRVIEKTDPQTNEKLYQVHEVFYDEQGDIENWTEDSVSYSGESLSELRNDITYHHRAFQEPVLVEAEQNGKLTLVESDEPVAINPGHYFEFLDRSSVAIDYLYQFLGSHPLLKEEPELKKLYEKADEALAKLYVEAGNLEMMKNEQ